MLHLVAANKDGVPGTNKENAMHNPAYNISAALTYATQLVNVLAYYVNIRLPYKLTCGYVSRVMYANANMQTYPLGTTYFSLAIFINFRYYNEQSCL